MHIFVIFFCLASCIDVNKLELTGFSQHTSLAKSFLFPVKHFEKILLMREETKILKRSQATKITIWKSHVDGIHFKKKEEHEIHHF